MSIKIFIFTIFVLLFCSPVLGQNFKLDDYDNLLLKKEKTVLENAINYKTNFFNRVFTDKTVDFSQIKFTITPNYMSYIQYQSQTRDGAIRQNSGFYSPSKRELVVCKDIKCYSVSFDFTDVCHFFCLFK